MASRLRTGASNLKVEILDGPFYRGGNDYVLVGDNPQGGSPGPTTIFMLYGPDPTPLNTTDGNKLLCKVEFAPRDPYMPSATSSTDWATVDTYLQGQVIAGMPYTADAIHNGTTSNKTYNDLDDLWDEMCPSSVFNEGEGIYPLRVVVKHPGASDDRGLNRFSLRASTAVGPAPRFYGLGDMAIYANFTGSSQHSISPSFPKCMPGRISLLNYGIRTREITVSRSRCRMAVFRIAPGQRTDGRSASPRFVRYQLRRPRSTITTCRFVSSRARGL